MNQTTNLSKSTPLFKQSASIETVNPGQGYMTSREVLINASLIELRAAGVNCCGSPAQNVSKSEHAGSRSNVKRF